MTDYISREAAIKAVSENDCEGYATWAVKAIPVADVRPVVRGKWKEDWETGCSECSACHDTFLWEDYNGVAEWNFCPNCGARMEES